MTKMKKKCPNPPRYTGRKIGVFPNVWVRECPPGGGVPQCKELGFYIAVANSAKDVQGFHIDLARLKLLHKRIGQLLKERQNGRYPDYPQLGGK